MAAERPEKKEKKDKKRSDEGGVSKTKKDKKDKKEKKEKLAAVLDQKLQEDDVAQSGKETKTKAVARDADHDSDMEDDVAAAEALPLERTVVPFAVPVADEKGMKKVYKTIRKGMFKPPHPSAHFSTKAFTVALTGRSAPCPSWGPFFRSFFWYRLSLSVCEKKER